MNFFYAVLIALALLSLALFVRVARGITIWDRLMGLNMISAKILMAIVILALITQKSYYLDIAIAYAVLGFIGTILIARFVKKRGSL